MLIQNAWSLAVSLLLSILIACSSAAQAADPPPNSRGYRVFHVMSYHSPWRWTDGQLQGFKDGFGKGIADIEVFSMNAKALSSTESKQQKGRDALALIARYKPDLVYTSDDEAQEFVAKHLVGSQIPVVFSGVNKSPSEYGFVGSPNVTGVLEHEHFVESVGLLRQLVPSARRIAVVFDDAPLWKAVSQRMNDALKQLPGIEIVAWDTLTRFEDFQQKMLSYPGKADAVALIGVFNFKDQAGNNVPYQTVLRWTAENSKLPDLAFWIDRVYYGTLCAVTVSEREQGLAAGRLARSILVDGKPPASLPMLPTKKGVPAISLARARDLGITPTSTLLLSSEVSTAYEWNKKQ